MNKIALCKKLLIDAEHDLEAEKKNLDAWMVFTKGNINDVDTIACKKACKQAAMKVELFKDLLAFYEKSEKVS